MYDYLINEYVKRLTTDEIKKFAFNKGIELTEDETNLIFSTIKTKWRTFVHGNPRPILDEIKKQVRPLTYNKIETLYTEARDKYIK